jgi:23S rRNA (guanine1835-N2)-methyltransferase
MEHLPENLEGEIVDLGCGNGVIGLTLLAKNPEASVVFAMSRRWRSPPVV